MSEVPPKKGQRFVISGVLYVALGDAKPIVDGIWQAKVAIQAKPGSEPEEERHPVAFKLEDIYILEK